MKKFFFRVSFKPHGLKEAIAALNAGKHRHDVLETAVRVLEQDPLDDSVGYGGIPNILGEMELDGAFMNGDNRIFAAVAALKNYLPVRVARRLMERELHTLLVGAGAELFAAECGLEKEPTLSDEQRDIWVRDIKPQLESKDGVPLFERVKSWQNPVDKNFDTTVMIASDGQGMSAAASTSGWSYKYPGRVGDTPLAGAGVYVDSRYGGAACTYTGEMSTRAGTARIVVEHLKQGMSVRQALHAAVDDLSSLRGGVLRTLVVHAIDREGEAHAVAINAERPVYYCFWHEGLPHHEKREAEPLERPSLRSPGSTPFLP